MTNELMVRMLDEIPASKLMTLSVNVVQYEEAAAQLIEQAERAEIVDEETLAKGGDLIKVSRAHALKAEDQRKKLVGPLNKVVRFINDAFNKGPKVEFGKVRKIIEPKMNAWREEENRRLREEAKEKRRALEEEALAKAERASNEEDQEKILNVAADVGEEVVEKAGVTTKRGMFGSTGTRKQYRTEVINMQNFLQSLLAAAKNGDVELGSVIEFRKHGLNNLAKEMLGNGIKELPGAKFIETDQLRVY